jgi:hypothetical protein
MKRIHIDEVKKRIGKGDLVYREFENYREGSGWHINYGDFLSGINTISPCGWATGLAEVEKIIFADEFIRGRNQCLLSEFLHTFDESLIQDFIYEVYYSTEQEVQLQDLITKLEGQFKEARDELAQIKQKAAQ